jgi:YVTN family beta-propeller protein
MRDQGTSTIVPALIGFSDGNRRVSITPKEPLEALTAYDIEVTAGIRDAAGGVLENPSTTVFTTTVPPPLRLDAVQPPSGLRGTNVVLSGRGFDRNPEDNVVLFNGEPGAVTEASNDHLVAVVPYDAAAGNITVQVEVLGAGSNMLLFRVLVPDVGSIDEDVIQKVGTGSTTRSVVVTPDGAMMYAVSPVSNSVVVVDIDEFAPVATIPVGENPFSIDIDPEGDFAFVTNFLSNDVSVIDIAEGSPHRNTVVSTIDVGLNPIDALVTPDGDRLIVSNMGSMDLSIVDTDPSSETYHMVLASVGTGSTTRAVTITPDGGLLYVGTSDGYLVIDVVDYSVVKTVSTGSTTKSVTVTPDGALLVLLTTQGEVLLVDIAEGSPSEDQVVGRVTTGTTTKSVTVTPDGGLLYLVLEGFDEIITVSLERTLSAEAYDSPDHAGPYPVTATVRDTIRAGEDPQQVAFAPNGRPIAVITNAGDNSVSIYNPEGVVIAVAISQFTARQSGERAVIEWRTHVEDGTEGFNILRSEEPGWGYQRITSSLLPAGGVPSTYRYEDEHVHPGRTYYYKIESVSVTGRSELFGPIEFVYRARFAVHQNVPNPFNPVTKIRFTIPDMSPVRLTVYDVAGRRIRTLVDRMLPADNYEISWDGTNNEGRAVASGIYFYRLEAGKYSQTRKMVLLR